ncbi:DUF6022 family protein [Paenibacillus sp. GCM10023248]|uniref:DUF6022 family protein n=1 Tax=Bacillales TaxID=1385 RepID=UPI002378E152|nr:MULTISPECIES: DUF6022 family protein [Bacillales]MDD9268012.1 DUF6022 family protein [Paenibacillus sp. MAHUQ-63]MDR6879685.1 hypothetical protein [Bacillus sp. 3255]
MKTLSSYLHDKEPAIGTIVKYANYVLNETWQNVLRTEQAELTRMFIEYGDRAYGVYIQHFMSPFFEQLSQNDLHTRHGFNLADSIENWGPPEERERCAWYVIKKADGTPIGTLVLQIYHSHVNFNVPHAPRAFALEVTEREDILEAISYAVMRVVKQPKDSFQAMPDVDAYSKWEYSVETGLADALRPYKGQTGGNFVDLALAAWGRNGWELVSVVPQGQQLAAFFKRRIAAT